MISLKAATQGIEEGGFLSPSLSIRNAMEYFRVNNLWDRDPLSSSFNFDGRLAANDGDGCMAIATDE